MTKEVFYRVARLHSTPTSIISFIRIMLIGAAGGEAARGCGASVRESTVRLVMESVSSAALPNL